MGEGDIVAYLAPAEPAEVAVTARSEAPAAGPRRQVPPTPAQSVESRRNDRPFHPTPPERARWRFPESGGDAPCWSEVDYRDLRPYAPRLIGGFAERNAPVHSARRKLGLTEIRFVIRVISAGEGEVGREDVQRLRAELTVANAHAGISSSVRWTPRVKRAANV